MDGTYGARMKETFRRILELPPEKSDNAVRVRRVLDFAKRFWGKPKSPSLLDIGSGLAVFPFRMKEAGWRVTALDPDPRAAAHARKEAGVESINADFLKWKTKSTNVFDAISINKVLEHIDNPVRMLIKAWRMVRAGGFLYVEVPDVAASNEGPGREEFYVEHLHVFSPLSLRASCKKAGFKLANLQRIKDPSGKYTIFGFARLNENSHI